MSREKEGEDVFIKEKITREREEEVKRRGGK